MAGRHAHQLSAAAQYVLHLPQIIATQFCQREYPADMGNRSSGWNFDVSSFMVLVGEAEEFNYRLMRRSLLECLSAAPVAGLQSYIRSNYALLESTGLYYFSPRGCKSAPLRNMRLMQSISSLKTLRDGTCKVYQIPATGKNKRIVNRSNIAAVSSWVLFAGIMSLVAIVGDMSWVGYSSCSALTAWSITLRLAERYCLKQTVVKNTHPDQPDAIYILGRRNSCFILQGSREDVSRWTGQGLEQRDGSGVDLVCWCMRLGSLAILLLVLIVIPNGATWDQVAFILLNTMGQLNVMLGQKLNARACFEELEMIEDIEVPTRTHVYAYLLRKFGNGDWVDKAGLLPHTQAWTTWRDGITRDHNTDPKQLYGRCAEGGNIEHIVSEKRLSLFEEVEVPAGCIEEVDATMRVVRQRRDIGVQVEYQQ